MRAWEEASPQNVSGRARALTTLAPIPQRVAWWAKLRFLARRMLGPPRPLNELSFIHYARTAVITSLDDADAASRHPAYIYFESNFNGNFDAYIDAFSYVVPRHMKFVWQGAYGFPGPKPATPFKRYIREHDFPAAHYYSAYPDAGATDISAALTVKDRLAPLARSAQDLAPEAFASQWFAAIRDTPAPRGPKSSPGYLLKRLWALRNPPDPNQVAEGNVYGLTFLSPIARGSVDALRTQLARIGDGATSPFADVPGTHFARLVVIEDFPAGRTEREVPGPHLLFSAVVDPEPGSYLRELCSRVPDTVDAVWGACAGAPTASDPRTFERWMRRAQLTTTTFFAPYGEASVEEVTEALRLRRAVHDFASRTQYATARTLQREFLREFVHPVAHQGAAISTAPRLDYEDIQGNVLRGYGNRFPYAAFVAVELAGADAGRRLLAELAGRVTDARDWNGDVPDETLNVAISYAGLERLGLGAATLARFPAEFADGMAARAGQLGDVGPSSPDGWEKGLRPGQVHVLVVVHARTQELRTRRLQWLDERLADCGGVAGRSELADRGEGDDFIREHFNYRDGYGQPAVAGQLSPEYPGQGTPHERRLGPLRLGRGWRLVEPGEFILGYGDEDGPPEEFAAESLARNGTFMVYRKLAQDVPGFRQLLHELAAEHFSGDLELAAAKVAGRWSDGTPLIASPAGFDPTLAQVKERANDFRYDGDPQGYVCPLGAHARRANPRDALPGKGERTRRHRIIRRGMPYGPRLADGDDDDRERGLLFVCFNASIARQFEVVNGWLTSGEAFGLPDGDLLTHRAGRAAMTMEGDPPVVFEPRRLHGPLVTVRGGEYLFLPGRRTLAALAAGSWT